jgi:hypothetical protein
LGQTSLTAIFTGLNMGIIAFFAVILIYCLVLFIKIAQKGLKALDIYIKNNERKGP